MQVEVGIGGLKVVDVPATLVGTALGSCVALIIYEEGTMIAGLAHIMLPSTEYGRRDHLPAKFADLTVPRMLSKLEGLGADRRHCRAKLAGGATMFSGLETIHKDLGGRNIEAVKAKLSEFNIPVMSEDIGAEHGRTVEFDTTTERMLVKSIRFHEKVI